MKMSTQHNEALAQVETTCGSLLYELQIIWNEVGESDADRDRMLLELERECLEVYRRKVDQANKNRAQLRRAIADSEAELAAICSSMGERPVHIRQADQNAGSLKEELQAILPQLEEMRKRKSDRRNQFVEVMEQISLMSSEIYGSSSHMFVDETDLSMRKIEELHKQLEELQKEKRDRLNEVHKQLDALNSLCLVLGMDFIQTASEIHPSYGQGEEPTNITTDMIQLLTSAVHKLRGIKIQRMEKLRDLAIVMLELWNLMDTPVEEQQMFQNVTCNIASSEHEITEPNTLSIDFINHVETEVCRLEALKSSRMRDLVLKKQSELEEICRKTHIVPEADTSVDYALEAMDSGNVDPASVLEQLEFQIGVVKEEALGRKEILEKMEKWLAACEEESWLEEYNRDENRYNAGKGAHLILKRAEKARSLVNKLPGMVETLASKTMAWEKERGMEFLYDGVHLLSMLEEYTILRQEKEEERQRQRDQKKLQGQLLAEQEVLYGSKPSPSKAQVMKKAPRVSSGGASNRRLSLQTPRRDVPNSIKATPNSRINKNLDQQHRNEFKDDGLTGLSAGRRGLDIAGLPVRKHSFNSTPHTLEPESPMLRKPFSPIASLSSSKSNVLVEDHNSTPTHEVIEKVKNPMHNDPTTYMTPVKTTWTDEVEEENETPVKTRQTVMQTVSVPMQTVMTPHALKVLDDIEYSFEEMRAGFIVALPENRIKQHQESDFPNVQD